MFYFYVAACIAVSFMVYWRMDESSKASHIKAELDLAAPVSGKADK